MFDFLLTQTLRSTDFEQETEFLISGFLAKSMITLIYADGGMGKSWLAFAVASACSSFQKVIYLDYDNPLTVLKERGVHEKLIGKRNIHYVQRSKSIMSAPEMLDALDAKASGNAYANTLILVDSLRNFGDVQHDAKIMSVMDKFMNLREAGATILILSHANKDGKNYQGSNNIRNSIDNMYRLKKVDAAPGEIAFVLTPTKERCAIIECAFSVRTADLKLQGIDVETARLNADELDFISQSKAAITEQPGINKKALLEQLGYEQDDKTARNKLDAGEGKHWQSSKVKGVYTYQLITNPIATSATSPAN
ncbi:helicase RepA family protein [Alishewanella sp. 16-MA]|uniref:Helicase RepA family protein n=1 Tax=Alishewanella maricola TaxID=2795740 RepID=A0ABS8C1Z6_9ALTE|nr:AAA family ATPase [Alishewanella maricola]MCB5226155.1 helicase RepA family protein [Alishewanella maricola]